MTQSAITDTEALALALAALELIATPARSDGTYNRCRAACELLASDALSAIRNGCKTPPLTGASLPASLPALSNDSSALRVYTDGGCKGNPGPAGWGVVIASSSDVSFFEARGFIGHGTNQIAELVAAIEGLSHTPEGAQVTLLSDSQYVLKGLTEWRKGWEKNGWVNAAKQPVANQVHWKKLCSLADQRKVTVLWVKGHSGNRHNERCDVLAGMAIMSENLVPVKTSLA